jgi:hypothetical protein
MKSNNRPGIQDIRTAKDQFTVSYADGRIISWPRKRHPRLPPATPAPRRNWELLGRRCRVHGPDVDEDLSTEGLLKGWPARESCRSLGRVAVRARQHLLP